MNEAPGTKLYEKDISQVSGVISNNIIGIYGRSAKGRVGELITITNTQDIAVLLGTEDRLKYGFGVAGVKIALEGTNRVVFARVVGQNTKYSGLGINHNKVVPEGTTLNPTYVTTGFTRSQYESKSFIDPSDTDTLAIFVSDFCGESSNSIYIKFSNFNQEYKTFSISVYEKDVNDNLIDTGEFFDECSFEQGHVDGYGNSTFIEDRINDKSDYIRVQVNQNEALTDKDAVPTLYGQTYAFTGGEEGDKPVTQDYLDTLDLFSDPVESQVGIIPDLGDATESSAAIQQKLLTLSKNRQGNEGAQFHVVMTTPKNLKKANLIVEWCTNVLNINHSMASLFSPWLKSLDTKTNANIEIPSSLVVAKMLASAEIGASILGLNRGLVYCANYTILGPTVNFKKGDQDTLFTNNINPIVVKPGVGTVIWGQQTRQLRKSALTDINVRRTMDYLEYNLMTYAKQYIGEHNDARTRKLFFDDATQLGIYLAGKEAIVDFAVKCDSDNNTPAIIDQNKLILYMAVKPSRVINWVEVTAIVTKSDANLSEVLTSNN